MSENNKNFGDLYVVGKSPFQSHFENEYLNTNFHNNCLRRELIQIDRQRPEEFFIPETRSCWYLNDHHLDSGLKTYQSLKNLNDLGEQINSIRYDSCDKEVELIKPIDVDNLARKYFPITLGKAYEIDAQINSNNDPPWSVTFSPPPNGVPRPISPWRVPTMHNRTELFKKWKPTEKHLEENRHFLSCTPIVKTDDRLSMIKTPYQAELSKLRLDRLRLEDEMLMEVKRQEELERIRGPEPKWYELRDSTFHYEAKKNNDLLKSCNNWQNLYDYRNSLKRKSEEFYEKYNDRSKSYDPTNYIPVS